MPSSTTAEPNIKRLRMTFRKNDPVRIIGVEGRARGDRKPGAVRMFNPQSRARRASADRVLQRRFQHLAGAGLLHKNNQPGIFEIRAGLQLEVDHAAESLPFLDFSDLGKLLYHGYVTQM